MIVIPSRWQPVYDSLTQGISLGIQQGLREKEWNNIDRQTGGLLSSFYGRLTPIIKQSYLQTGQLPFPKYSVQKVGKDLAVVNPYIGEIVQKVSATPQVKSVHFVDTGDRITPFVVLDNGDVKIPASFYKSLSPYQRQQLKLKAQQLGLQKVKLMQDKEWRDFLKTFKIEELNTQKQKMQMDYSLRKQNLGLKSAELQLKAKQLQGSLQDQNLKRIGQQVNLLMKAGNALLKKYKLDINSLMNLDEIKAHDVIGEIAKVNPVDAERLRRIYERLNQLVSKGAGINQSLQAQQNQQSPIPLQTKNFLKGWGIE